MGMVQACAWSENPLRRPHQVPDIQHSQNRHVLTLLLRSLSNQRAFWLYNNMSEETANALDIVVQQGKRHQQIMEEYEGGSHHEARYNYERWVTKTEELIRQHVSLEEAQRFSEVVNQSYNVFRHGKGFELVLFYDSVQAFLLGLMRGIVSNHIEVNPAALQSKRKLVLYKLYEMAPDDKIGDVIVSDLATALGMGYQEVNNILEYWQRKGMVRDGSFDASTRLEPYAIDEIEEARRTGKATKHIPETTIYYTDNRINIGGDNSGQVMAGNQGTQNMGQPTGEIISQLGEFIKAVRALDFPDKDDAVRDLEKAKELSSGENAETKWKLIQAKLASAKTAMELAGYAHTALPYGMAIYDYFFK
jgi:hypothetical protein